MRRPVRPHPDRTKRTPRGLFIAGAALVISGLLVILLAWNRGQPPAVTPVPPTAGAPQTVAATPVLSARRIPSFTTALIPVRAMAAAMDPIAAASPAASCLSIGNGTEGLYLHNASTPVIPASNQKLLTASAAMELIGEDEVFTTAFDVAAPMKGGVVDGDLFMVGGGDPVLTTDAYQARQSHGDFPATDLEAVADSMVADGLVEITGAVVGDASRYDSERGVPGWPQRWFDNGTVAPLSALLVNDGWVMDPVTGEGSTGPTPDPAQHTAAVFARLLTDRGVKIGGPARSGRTPEGAQQVAVAESAPVKEVLKELLAFSDNTTAEMFLKEMGFRSSGTGSTEAGVAAVEKWVSDIDLDTDGWVMVDGSGLSSGNRMTCSMLGALLRRSGPDSPLAAGLAVPGQSGTLDERLDSGELPERLRAKTGTLNDVAALSGWLGTDPGAVLDFEYVMNSDAGALTATDLGLQPRMLTALLAQPVAPPLDAAGPIKATDG